jgi:AcrR family transcriptional regulator
MTSRANRDVARPAIRSGIKDEALLATRRARVVEIATELFIRRGFAEVSVNEIADAAGMSVGSLYKYIRAKEDILWLVMDSIYGTLEAILSAERSEAKDAAEALDHAMRRLFHAVATVRRGILLMYREYRNLPKDGFEEFKSRERAVVNVFVGILEDGNRDGTLSCPDPQLAALQILMASHTWALKRWLIGAMALDDYIEQQVAMVNRMVGVAG